MRAQTSVVEVTSVTAAEHLAILEEEEKKMKESRANNNNNPLKRSFESLYETGSAPSQPCKKRRVLTDVTNVVQKQDTAWRVSKVVDENSELRKKIELEDVNNTSKKDAASKDGSTTAEEQDATAEEQDAISFWIILFLALWLDVFWYED